MEKDLTQKFPRDKAKSEALKSTNKRSKELKCVKINNESIVLKIAAKESMYQHEKKIYMLLKNETFIPELKYYDDKHFILGIAWAGRALNRMRRKAPTKYNRLYENINEQLTIISDKLYTTYGLYHNDLRYKNICVQNKKVKVIDFDDTGPEQYIKNGVMRPKYFICKPVKIKT
jgi:thiamine kinase-like enzyme